MRLHLDCDPGLTMESVVVTELSNHGKPCFKATARIGTIFGFEVEGECSGIGPTIEIALQRLDEDRKRLYESLWL